MGLYIYPIRVMVMGGIIVTVRVRDRVRIRVRVRVRLGFEF